MKKFRVATWAATAAMFVLPHAASANDFSTCDGFAAPTRKTDGMTEGTWMFGLAKATVDLRATSVVMGERGIEACDRALADPLLLPEQWLRRANLLQAKALHALAASKPDIAIEAAGLSDQTGKADPYFVASLGLGNHAIRALALNDLGRKDEALAEIESVGRAQPWSASMRRLATQLQFKVDPDKAQATFRENVPFAPENARMLYWESFLTGDYATALTYASAISWELPKKRGGWTMSGEQQRTLSMIEERAEFEGSLAFALTMQGRADEAQLVRQGADEDLADAMAEPPERAPGKPAKKQDIAEWKARLPYARKGKTKLDLWTQAAEFIGTVPTLEREAAFRTFATGEMRNLPIFPAVLGKLTLSTPEETATRDLALEQYLKGIAKERVEATDFTIRELAGMLPKRLTAKMIPVMKPAGDGYFLSDTGLSKAREGKTDVWTIRFVHKTAPIHIVEELAMYGAALTALDQGKDSVVILSRRSAELTTNVIGYYGGGISNSFSSGYEAQLRVQMVNAGQLPPELAGQDYRALPAQAIVDDMSKRYREGGGITIAW